MRSFTDSRYSEYYKTIEKDIISESFLKISSPFNVIVIAQLRNKIGLTITIYSICNCHKMKSTYHFWLNILSAIRQRYLAGYLQGLMNEIDYPKFLGIQLRKKPMASTLSMPPGA